MEHKMTSPEAGVGHAMNGGVQAQPERRRVGRPSTVVEFASQITEWLRAEPTLSGAELLNRVRLMGYRGGKSALYELVRRLRQTNSGNN
jgi:hypothetical protein